MISIAKISCCFILISLFVGVPKSQADEGLPSKVLAKVLLTIMTYDKNLQQHRSPVLKIGVVQREKGEASQRSKDIMKGFQAYSDLKVKGLPFEAELFSISKDADLNKIIMERKYNILVFCRDSLNNVPAITALTSSYNVLTITGFADYVRNGVAIGAVLRAGKPKIMINLTSSKAQGASLDARLLNLAEVVR